MTVLNALVADDGVTRGLTALLAEIGARRALRLHADRAGSAEARTAIAYLEQALVERDKSPSAPLADEFIRNFMNDEPIPGIVYEHGAVAALPAGDHARGSQRGRQDVGARRQPRRRRHRARSGRRRRCPTEPALAAAIKAPATRTLTAYVDRVNTQPLLDPLPTPGHDRARRRRSRRIGVTEWRLSNGARVVLKPTTFKEDEILFRAVSPGGTSLASDDDFIAASTADDVMAQGGLGALSRAST